MIFLVLCDIGKLKISECYEVCYQLFGSNDQIALQFLYYAALILYWVVTITLIEVL